MASLTLPNYPWGQINFSYSADAKEDSKAGKKLKLLYSCKAIWQLFDPEGNLPRQSEAQVVNVHGSWTQYVCLLNMALLVQCACYIPNSKASDSLQWYQAQEKDLAPPITLLMVFSDRKVCPWVNRLSEYKRLIHRWHSAPRELAHSWKDSHTLMESSASRSFLLWMEEVLPWLDYSSISGRSNPGEERINKYNVSPKYDCSS